jgi:3-phenylpropionate/trans-cinnamate dioxygenase ferredoxin reductase subunit
MLLPTETYAIVGAGVCGASAAATLRTEGFSGRLVMIGDEEAHPYQRPPLSKALLKKAVSPDSIEVRSRSWYDENSIELIRACNAASIDLSEQCVRLEGADDVFFDKVLIATGSSARRLDGVEGARVFYLRSMDDAMAMADHLEPGSRIAIIGGGLIGAEVAATAQEAGVEAVIIEPQPVLMQNTAGALVGRLYSEMHEQHGVKLMLGESLAQVRAGREGVEVVTKSGAIVKADILLICIGIRPNDAIARSAKLDVHNGIVVDQFFSASHPAVFAAGDVASAFYPRFSQHIRTEGHDSAIKQGAGAAMNMLGLVEPNNDVPWGWSDQYGQNLQFAGCRSIADQSIVRGDVEGRSFTVLYTHRGQVCAALSLNRGREMVLARRMIAAAAHVDAAAAADDGISLQKGFLVDPRQTASTLDVKEQ